jgi:endoglucanase
MVPAPPLGRGPRRRRWVLRLAVTGFVLAALAGAAVAGSHRVRARVKDVARKVLGYRAWKAREALPPEDPFFGRLAASQVGYAPGMRKEFSSPGPFDGFVVVKQPGGEVVLRGGGPVREIRTEVLGPIRSAYVGDFTALQAPGRYRVVASNGLSSLPFEVGPGVFDAPVRAVQRALYYQRAFTEIEPGHAEGPWVHPSDAHLAPAGVEKGWHDAGDYSIYSASAVSNLYWLLAAAADFAPDDDDTNIPESGNGVPDLLDEARWGLEWLLSVQARGSGGFGNTVCMERYGRYGTNLPHRMPPYRFGELGTIPTGRAVGTLAFASAVYRRHDPAFARRCLVAALRGWLFLEAHPGATDGPTCPVMRQDGDEQAGREVRMYAAAGLLLATGDPAYREPFEANYSEIWNDPSFHRTNVYAALLYLRATAAEPGRRAHILGAIRAQGDHVLEEGAAHPFGWASRYFWGSIAAGFQRTNAFSVGPCLADAVAAAAHCEQALANVHYTLGRNAMHLAYVSGLPGVTRGRSRVYHHWLSALDATPFTFPGLVAGGPLAEPEGADVSKPWGWPRAIWGYWGDPAMPRDGSTPLDGRYTDNDSWSANEIDVEWQGITLYGLYFARAWARSAGHARGGPLARGGGEVGGGGAVGPVLTRALEVHPPGVLRCPPDDGKLHPTTMTNALRATFAALALAGCGSSAPPRGTMASQAAADTAVTWSATGGSVDQTGRATAPATTGAFTVTARSVADATKSGSATVNVRVRPPGVGAVALPLISRTVPATASAGTASHGQDASYGGPLWGFTAAQLGGNGWLAYDLSGVPAASRQTLLVALYQGLGNGQQQLNFRALNNPDVYQNAALSYVLEGATSAGGPWTTLVSVAQNCQHYKTHLIDFSAHTWLRFRATSGSPYLQMDVYDAGAGVGDGFALFGDSIISNIFSADYDGFPPEWFSKAIAAQRSGFFPPMVGGGVPFMTAGDAVSVLVNGTGPFTGGLDQAGRVTYAAPRYVGLVYGANDGDADSLTAAFRSNYRTIIDAFRAQGQVVVLASPTWATDSTRQGRLVQIRAAIGYHLPDWSAGTFTVGTYVWNAAQKKVYRCTTAGSSVSGPAGTGTGIADGGTARWAYVSSLREDYANDPQVIGGPDLYTVFEGHPGWLGDGLHPNDVGSAQWRNAWIDWALSTVY